MGVTYTGPFVPWWGCGGTGWVPGLVSARLEVGEVPQGSWEHSTPYPLARGKRAKKKRV